MDIVSRLQEDHCRKIEELELSFEDLRSRVIDRETSDSFPTEPGFIINSLPGSSDNGHETNVLDLKNLQSELDSCCLRIGQLDRDLSCKKDDLMHSQQLLHNVIAFFDILRSKLHVYPQIFGDFFNILDSVDCRSMESLALCSQQLERLAPPLDSNLALLTDSTSATVDLSDSARCSGCLQFNARFFSSRWSSLYYSGLGFIRRFTAHSSLTPLLSPLYSRLESRTHLTEDERNV
jgi:hypothetical protein